MENYKFKNDKVILLGDTHSQQITKDIIGSRVDGGVDLIHLGDVGLGFAKKEYAIKNTTMWLYNTNKLCHNLGINFYIIRGNHDATYDEIWDQKFSNVFLIKDHAYAVFPNGKKALLLAGGISIDRYSRRQDYDYWTAEGTIPIDYKVIEKCDIMFSHDCPEQFNHSSHTIPTHWKRFHDVDPTLYHDCLAQRELVSEIVKVVECKTIFHGHMHNNMRQTVDGVYCRCVDINELFFFDSEKEYKV
jgi:predicted phosphodiesterase